jgi:hypothetical protein
MRTLGVLAVVACSGGGSMDTEWTMTGECDPPAGATVLAVTPIDVGDPCGGSVSAETLRIADSVAAWNAAFPCLQPPPVPSQIDFAVQRVAIVLGGCSPIYERFAAERDDEVVVGIHTGISGACLGNVIAVPLPRSTKPVRLAFCRDSCSGYCPPVP